MAEAINVNKFVDDYKLLYEAIMRVQRSLNGPLLDRIGLKAESLFNDVVSNMETTNGMSRGETIAFLKKLRVACLALVDLKNHLVQTINNELHEREIDVLPPEIVEQVEDLSPNEIVEEIDATLEENQEQIRQEEPRKLSLTPDQLPRAA